jgi:hypothetical protein
VMVSIIEKAMTDEHNGLLIVISPSQEHLVETGSDKLPSFPWDPVFHLVSRMFHYMKTQVVPESHILHLGLVSREPAGTFPVGRDLSSLMIIMIAHGYVWMGTSSIEMSLLIQFLDSRSNSRRYFS